MRVPPLVLYVFFAWGIPQLQSDWSLSCDHGLDYASECENNSHESCPSAARFRVKARQTRISIKARQTSISRLLASQGPHVGYVCSTPQIFMMTDLRRTDTTEFRGRL